MNEEIEVLRGYVETLGLDQKESLTMEDLTTLRDTLKESDEFALANYIGNLSNEKELQDLIVNTLYG